MKSEQSIRLKYAKGLKSGLRFNTVFNDLIGLRIKVQEYPHSYPDYFRVVDMRNGKKNYDGYRAVHLYYKLDNFHYQVEIQLWSDADYTFNDCSTRDGKKRFVCRNYYVGMNLNKSIQNAKINHNNVILRVNNI